jgi:hypothetical protein
MVVRRRVLCPGVDQFNAQLSKENPTPTRPENLNRYSMGGLICSMLVREGGENFGPVFRHSGISCG